MMTFDHDKFLPPFVKVSTSPQTPEPLNVLIYHGTHSENPSYTPGLSSTEMPIPRKKHTPSLSSMIQAISPSSSITKMALLVEPYTSTSGQHLFTTQACIPMTAIYEANQWACPDNPSQL
jgi:hypothetical protein